MAKPPEHTQFKPKQSGNPKGRPKGAQNFATLLSKELAQTVTANVNGKKRKVQLRGAIAKQVAHKAAAGDPKAIGLVIQHDRAQEDRHAGGNVSAVEFNKLDEVAIRSLAARLAELHAASVTATALTNKPAVKPEKEKPS